MLGKTENRQVWIDFPYPKEIFLALHFFLSFFLSLYSATPPREDYVQVDFVWKLKKRQYLLQREPGSFLQSGKRLSVRLLH